MTNHGTLQRDITIQGQKLETVDHFKYLGVIISDEGSRRECSPECSPDNGSTCQIKNHLERQENENKTQNKTNARPCHNTIPLCI